jgi:hypothetical protein
MTENQTVVPRSWDEAHEWEDSANKDSSIRWRFDCGFKLDYDGPLLSISSRFYPPYPHYGPLWSGTIHVLLANVEVARSDVSSETLDGLKEKVDAFVGEIERRVYAAVTNKNP